MSHILALDTATAACSVAMRTGVDVVGRHELIPRAHNQHVLRMVDEVRGELGGARPDVIVVGVGPGSFTGLRVAVSVAQGLAWGFDIPVIPICSLTSQLWTALSEGFDAKGRTVISAIDAQIGQLYWRPFRIEGGCPVPTEDAVIGIPSSVEGHLSSGAEVIGSGRSLLSVESNNMLASAVPDMRALLREKSDWDEASGLAAENLLPQYVQTDVGWKKLSEQG